MSKRRLIFITCNAVLLDKINIMTERRLIFLKYIKKLMDMYYTTTKKKSLQTMAGLLRGTTQRQKEDAFSLHTEQV